MCNTLGNLNKGVNMNNLIRLAKATKALKQRIAEALAGEVINFSAWNVMQYLYESEGGTAGQITEGSGISQPQVSMIVDSLTDLELVREIDTDDSRVKFSELTKSGTRLYHQLQSKVELSLKMSGPEIDRLAVSLKG